MIDFDELFLATQELATKSTNKHVVVIGDAMLDRFYYGRTTRQSPEANCNVIVVDRTVMCAGGAANAAIGVSLLGPQVTFISLVGDDNEGSILKSLIASESITSLLITDSTRPTSVKTRIFDSDTQLARIDIESSENISTSFQDEIMIALRESGTMIDALLISDYDKGLLTPELTRQVIEFANTRNIPVVVDPKGIDYSKYSFSTVITPNVRELELGSSVLQSDTLSMDNGVARLIKDTQESSSFIITRGFQGMSLYRPPGSYRIDVEAHECNPVDVTGAGDCVVSVVTGCLAAGIELEVAMKLANLAAAISVSYPGTHPVGIADILAAAKARSIKRHTL